MSPEPKADKKYVINNTAPRFEGLFAGEITIYSDTITKYNLPSVQDLEKDIVHLSLSFNDPLSSMFTSLHSSTLICLNGKNFVGQKREV